MATDLVNRQINFEVRWKCDFTEIISETQMQKNLFLERCWKDANKRMQTVVYSFGFWNSQQSPRSNNIAIHNVYDTLNRHAKNFFVRGSLLESLGNELTKFVLRSMQSMRSLNDSLISNG